ncbi:MAG TPA: hypothetical protein VN549_00200 [Negativicutes bacterium]|nr:hypothetical protein [Negativicutes bacterium]
MKLKKVCIFALALIMLVSLTTSVYAAPVIDGTTDDDSEFVQKEDNKPDPLTTAQLEMRKEALEAKLAGKAADKIHEVAKGQFVELAREGEDAIWTADFSREYYLDLLFNDAKGQLLY